MKKITSYKIVGIILLTILGLYLVSCDKIKPEENIDYRIAYSATLDEEAFLDTLQYRSFLYFMNEINHETGLVKDRSTENSPASTAAEPNNLLKIAILFVKINIL